MRLPLPMPEDLELGSYIEARYASSPEHWSELEKPAFPRTRDGFLAALHFFYQNNPVFFVGGWVITALALVNIAYRALRAAVG